MLSLNPNSAKEFVIPSDAEGQIQPWNSLLRCGSEAAVGLRADLWVNGRTYQPIF